MPDSDRIIVGRVGGVFGTRGWLKVLSFTRPRDNIFEYSQWQLFTGNQWRTFSVVEGRVQGKGLIATLREISNRDDAIALVQCNIAIARSLLPNTEEEEYYWADLIGLDVFNRENQRLGRVVNLLETGAHDVLVVEGDRQRLIPFVLEHFVDDVDLAGGLIHVDWHPDD